MAEKTGNNFDFEFHSEVPSLKKLLSKYTERKLRKLNERDRDITGATVLVTKPVVATTPFSYQVKIVLDVKKSSIVAAKTGGTVQVALKSALKAIEKQVTAHKFKIHMPWKSQHAEEGALT